MKAILEKYGRWVEIALLLALIGVAFGFGWSYAHKDTLLAQTQLIAANDKIDSQQILLNDLAAKAKEAKADEAAAKAREKKAGETLDAFVKALPKKESDFTKSTAELAKKPECVALTEHLCPAAMGY